MSRFDVIKVMTIGSIVDADSAVGRRGESYILRGWTVSHVLGKQHPVESPVEDRISLFGILLDPVTMDSAVTRVCGWIAAPWSVCRYIVTPNLDHVVRLQSDPDFRAPILPQVS